MKANRYFFFLLLLLIWGCGAGDATFTIHGKNFGSNDIIGIYNPTTDKAYTIENLTNQEQTMKVYVTEPAYAILKIKHGLFTRDFWIYLSKGKYDIVADGDQKDEYPITHTETDEGKEFQEFYKIKKALKGTLTHQLENAVKEFDESDSSNVVEKTKNMDKWKTKMEAADLDVIKTFAKAYPESKHTLFLLDQLSSVESVPDVYLSIYNLLAKDVQNSKMGKKLLDDINTSKQMMPGSILPNIEGTTPEGTVFNAQKFLKKLNVIICWATYDAKSRRDNVKLIKIYEKFKNKNVEFIGISYDKNQKWWTDVIRDDQLIWPQFSDLKGAQSPNAKTFSALRVPYMLFTDQKGKIISVDIDVDSLDFEIEDYLSKH